jgi:hypothetical protein
MYEVECAFRRENGALLFIHEDHFREATDDLCDLRVRFEITAIYPAEPDTGAAMDWNGDIASIEMRSYSVSRRRWCVLRNAELEAAKAFLLREYGAKLWAAGGEYAEALHYGEAA